VTFFWPIEANCWVIDLDPEYRWAVAADPDRTKLWILSRAPELDSSVYDGILKRAAAQGFDASKITPTRQTVLH
jgi:apolipoprotein D and lipocalin family protein